MNYWHILIPVLSAILGWTGAWFAGRVILVKVISSNRQNIARKIATNVSAEFSFGAFDEKVNDPENVKKIMPLIEGHIDDFLRNKLKTKMPMIGMFIGDKTIIQLKEVFLQEIEELFPLVLKQYAVDLRSQFDIETMVIKQINAVPAVQIEKIVAPSLRFFQMAGALTGFVIGVANTLIFYFLK
ncbi:MAG: DUF445 domain-containing protein [Verrucomicrobia bacterium]|nr:DUF445 domain-containing protein [Cytophagales bacterium]